ncbi:hypothetical protein BD560DRAFT_335072, partial [Blakeslea trispora]
MNNNHSTEFSQYLLQEKARSVPANNFTLDQSLRVWFIEFEQQADVSGVIDLNQCAPYITKFMPQLIQRWIPILPPKIRADYALLKESLLSRFAMNADDENRILLKQLRNCKK